MSELKKHPEARHNDVCLKCQRFRQGDCEFKASFVKIYKTLCQNVKYKAGAGGTCL